MPNTDDRKMSSSMSGGMAATVLGAALTIGAVVLSNKEVRNKLLKMVSQGIDKLTESGEGMKKTINDTANKVEKGTRQTMEGVKAKVDELTDDTTKGVKRAAAR